MAQFYTYLYVDPKTNKPIYVGKGKGDRAYVHTYQSSRPKNGARKLFNVIQKRIREGYCIEPIIQYEEDEQTALEMEKFWINLFGREDLKQGTLFNLTDGGQGLAGFSPWNTGLKGYLNAGSFGTRPVWNKGLTKENNETMRETSRKLSALNKGKPGTWNGKRHTVESIKKMSGENNHRYGNPAWNRLSFEQLSYKEQRQLFNQNSDRVPQGWLPKSLRGIV